MIRRRQAWIAPQVSRRIIQKQSKAISTLAGGKTARRQPKQDLKRSPGAVTPKRKTHFLSPSEGTRTPNLVDLLLSLRLDGLVSCLVSSWCPKRFEIESKATKRENRAKIAKAGKPLILGDVKPSC